MFTNNLMAWWMLNGIGMNKNYASYQNNMTFMNTFMKLFNFAINTFEWKGLPDTVNEKYFEYALLFNGQAAIADDKNLSYIGLPFSYGSDLNIYGDTNKIRLYGTNGYSQEFNSYIRGLNDENLNINAVRCFDNRVGYPYITYIYNAAIRITQTLRSIDVAVKKLKNPYIFAGDKSNEADYKKLFESLENNDEAILLQKGLEKNDLNINDVHIDVQVVVELWNQYERLVNNIQETLGVTNNPNFDKKSGVNSDEINSNNQSTSINLDIRLKTREEFCEDLKDCFGLDVSVGIRHQNMIEAYDLVDNDNEQEDNEDGDDNNGVQ